MIDLSINNNVVEYRDIDLIIQQIDILFDTQRNDVFGEQGYGSNFDQFLWDMNISNNYIETYIYNLIYNNINLLDFTLQVKCQICQGTMNDIILITISLKKELEVYEKNYKIT